MNYEPSESHRGCPGPSDFRPKLVHFLALGGLALFVLLGCTAEQVRHVQEGGAIATETLIAAAAPALPAVVTKSAGALVYWLLGVIPGLWGVGAKK